MDNRLTRKRLTDYLAYEWILIIFLCVVAIIVWELVYTITSVRLSVGQDFKFYYDMNLDSSAYSNLYNEIEVGDNLGYENGKTFSFDVLKVHQEGILESSDVLSTRLSVHEGDIIFSDDVRKEQQDNESEKYLKSVARSRVDNSEIPITSYDKMFSDAKAYLQGLLKDGLAKDKELELDFNNLDDAKIKAGFEKRLGGDNRFRSDEQKKNGLELEIARIKKLCGEVADFKKIIELPNEYFFCYTRFEQSLEIEKARKGSNIKNIETSIQKEKNEGRENARYGLRPDKLKTDGKTDPTQFFRMYNSDGSVTAEGIVIMVFNFVEQQPELHFESISVINAIVRACSTILD